MAAILSKDRHLKPATTSRARQLQIPSVPGRPVELKSTRSRLKNFVWITAFALFWNGIVAILLSSFIRDWIRFKPGWLEPQVMIPFVVFVVIVPIGLLLILAVLGAILNFFNPRIRLTVSSASVVQGGLLNLQWELSGRKDRIKRMKITLEGRKTITTHHQGESDTKTITFATIPVIEAQNRFQAASGNARANIPHDALPTGLDSEDSIAWYLTVEGFTDKRLDFNDEFNIEIMPR